MSIRKGHKPSPPISVRTKWLVKYIALSRVGKVPMCQLLIDWISIMFKSHRTRHFWGAFLENRAQRFKCDKLRLFNRVKALLPPLNLNRCWGGGGLGSSAFMHTMTRSMWGFLQSQSSELMHNADFSREIRTVSGVRSMSLLIYLLMSNSGICDALGRGRWICRLLTINYKTKSFSFHYWRVSKSRYHNSCYTIV